MRELQTNILRVLRSERFFKAVLALFVLESVWIALSAAYPMVFDENTHFGVIQIYAQRLNPVFFNQPPDAAWAGPLTTQPSFLYQYLMSFPYRFIVLFTDNQMLQIIFLRFINIGLMVWGLVLFRRLLLKTGAPKALVSGVLLFFVLIPVVPLLAGQINYDNLLVPITGLALLMAVSVNQYLNRYNVLSVGRTLQLLTLCLLGCMVQFAFLPIFAAIFIWLAWRLWHAHKFKPLDFKQMASNAAQGSSWQRKLVVSLPLLIALALFAETYGVNLIVYHNPTPACHQVLTARECSQYGGWQRNQIALANKQPVDQNPFLYGASWTYRMFLASFYTSSGGASPAAYYLSINPLPVIFVTAIVIFVVGVGLFVGYYRRIVKRYRYINFLLFVCLLYGLALWLRNYADFIHVGEKIAINGRYVFPIALPAMLLIALAYRQALAQRHRLRIGLLVAVLVLFLQGGGALTYITLSDSSWYWQNRTIISMNRAAQRVIKPFIIIKAPVKELG